MSRREIVLVVILLTVLSGVIYYFFYFSQFWTDYNQTVSGVLQQETEIFNAELRQVQYEALAEQKARLEQTWAGYEASIPKGFDQPGSLYNLQDIIYPHTKNVTVSYSDIPGTGTEDQPETDAAFTGSVSVNLSFAVPYDAMVKIISDIENLEEDNRILSYSYARSDDEAAGEVYNVTLNVEFLMLN